MRYNFSMTYLITALYAEAKPLLEHWSFKRDKSLPCRLYRNDEMCLLVTQMGMENATKSVQALMQYLPPQKNDILINIGLCAAPGTYPVGRALQVNNLHYEDAILELPIQKINIPTISLRTVTSPASTLQDNAVDMEAYAIYKAAKSHFSLSHIAFLKIVSDHFEPEKVDKERAIISIKENIPKLEEVIESILGVTYE
ncbi:MAG: hypothetical protein U9Q62_00445 [Campylobacterota bacterium]|nr:hypothetical protein [Campylobacterota bacterium]